MIAVHYVKLLHIITIAILYYNRKHVNLYYCFVNYAILFIFYY